MGRGECRGRLAWEVSVLGKRGSTQGLSRKEEVKLAQLRSGQSKLLAAFRARVQGEDPVCPKCNGSEETLRHFMQECPATEATRRRLFEAVPPPRRFCGRTRGRCSGIAR